MKIAFYCSCLLYTSVPDAHEALIARQDFELVQRIKGLDTRTSPNEDTVYLLSLIHISASASPF